MPDDLLAFSRKGEPHSPLQMCHSPAPHICSRGTPALEQGLGFRPQFPGVGVIMEKAPPLLRAFPSSCISSFLSSWVGMELKGEGGVVAREIGLVATATHNGIKERNRLQAGSWNGVNQHRPIDFSAPGQICTL